MDIGLVASGLDRGKGGIRTYLYELTNKLNEIDRKNHYYLFHYIKSDLDVYKAWNDILVKKFLSAQVSDYVTMPMKIKSFKKLDLVHDPFPVGPLSFKMPFKKVITVHDITPVLFPQWFRLRADVAHRILFRRTLANVDRIITDSNNSKKDLIDYFNIPEKKINVIPLAANERFQPLDTHVVADIRTKYNFNFPFILYVGNLEPRKNISTLIKSFYRIKRKGIAHKLLIIGSNGWKTKKIFNDVNYLNLRDDVIFAGYVPEGDLPAIYNAADLFVYPSLYEGFGLPLIEAMACGTPVISSNTSSLPEVVGDAGILINPRDINGLSISIYKILTDEDTRERLSKSGLTRAKKFSWRNCAIDTLRVYEDLIDDR